MCKPLSLPAKRGDKTSLSSPERNRVTKQSIFLHIYLDCFAPLAMTRKVLFWVIIKALADDDKKTG